jgi:hypothetical protein
LTMSAAIANRIARSPGYEIPPRHQHRLGLPQGRRPHNSTTSSSTVEDWRYPPSAPENSILGSAAPRPIPRICTP